jgi:hypothetical protein
MELIQESPPLEETGLAGKRLQVGAERVRQLVRAGILRPALITASGRMLFDPRDVEALRQQREE